MNPSNSIEYISEFSSTQFIPVWYESATANHFWMKKRFDFLKEAFKALGLSRAQKLHILDIGSGNGVVRQQLEAESAWIVDCVDIDEAALKQTPDGRGRKLFYNIFDQNPQFLKKYDVVTLLDVMEHIDSPGPFLEAAVAHLKPGGCLVVNVPALPVLFSRYDECAGHVRRYLKSSLVAEVSGLNLQTRYLRYWGLILVPLLVIRKFMLRKNQESDSVINVGFQPKFSWINQILEILLTIEQKCIPFRFVGASLIYAGRLKDCDLSDGPKT